MDNQPRVYWLFTFRKCLLSMVFTIKWSLCFCRNQMMGLINYWSEVMHGQILLYCTMILRRDQRRIPGPWSLYTEKDEETCTWTICFPEIMRLIYWIKVNSSVIIFTDHCWSIPFCDKRFQCNILCCIIAFRVWAWFLVRTGKVCQSLEDISTFHSLNSSFNHYWISLSHCLIMLSIQFVHNLSSGFIP